MERFLLAVVIVVALGGALASDASAAQPSAAVCGLQHARIAAATRDCTIRGAVSGSRTTGDMTITWDGTLVLAQQFVDPYTGFPPSKPTFLPAAGSTVAWKLSGTSGDCTVSGSGTVAVMDGALTISVPKEGKWSYSLTVGPRHPRNSAEHVMPYTIACPEGSGTLEASLEEGMVFGYNGYGPGQPPANQITDGMTFGGEIHTPPPGNHDWSWKLTGGVFPQDVSEHGIALIKREEGLRLHAYEDQLHLCTIGYGHLIIPEGRCGGRRASMHWTRKQADAALRDDLDKLMEPYVRKQSIRLGMNQCEYDALSSFAYNVAHGKGGESKSWKSLIAGLDPATNWQNKVQTRLPTYVYGKDAVTKKRVELPDLVKRRARELRVFSEQKCACDGVAP
jgi:lysozyme